MRAQVAARAEHLVQRRHLEREVMQLAALRRPLHPADQRDPVVVGAEAHEHHPAGHHALRVDVRHPEAQHPGVEVDRAHEVGYPQHHMADLADAEGQIGWRDGIPQAGIVERHGPGGESGNGAHSIGSGRTPKKKAPRRVPFQTDTTI